MDNIEVHLTQEQAEFLLKEWQERLNLQHWKIKIKVARGGDLDLPGGLQGRCDMILNRLEAFIRILDPIDWDKTILWPQDMEATLVHELLHLHWVSLDKWQANSPEVTAMEQAIHSISHALVDAKRGRSEE